MTHTPSLGIALLADIRHLINAARQRVAVAVNAELTLLYWRIGQRINAEVLRGQRAVYGKQIVSSVAKQLTAEYGKGWSEQQLRHCLRVAETFPDEEILSTVQRELPDRFAAARGLAGKAASAHRNCPAAIAGFGR